MAENEENVYLFDDILPGITFNESVNEELDKSFQLGRMIYLKKLIIQQFLIFAEIWNL